jgi:hypothetical protein
VRWRKLRNTLGYYGPVSPWGNCVRGTFGHRPAAGTNRWGYTSSFPRTEARLAAFLGALVRIVIMIASMTFCPRFLSIVDTRHVGGLAAEGASGSARLPFPSHSTFPQFWVHGFVDLITWPNMRLCVSLLAVFHRRGRVGRTFGAVISNTTRACTAIGWFWRFPGLNCHLDTASTESSSIPHTYGRNNNYVSRFAVFPHNQRKYQSHRI